MRHPIPYRIYNIVCFRHPITLEHRMGTIVELKIDECIVQDADGGQYHKIGYYLLLPIPLDKWLKAAGFERNPLSEHEAWIKLSPHGRIIIHKNDSGFHMWMWAVSIFSVHDLSNLYHALTGEELTFNHIPS